MTRERHGRTKGPEYASWENMIQRCTNEKYDRYADYGGRGIRVCGRWRQFSNFLADMGERPPGTSIDRFPNKNGNYEPGNCRWATAVEQCRNVRDNRLVTYQGVTLCVAEWGARVGISPYALGARLRMGWPVERALTTPIQKRGSWSAGDKNWQRNAEFVSRPRDSSTGRFVQT